VIISEESLGIDEIKFVDIFSAFLY